MRKAFLLAGILLSFTSFAAKTEAAGPITYRYDHFLFTVPAKQVAGWQRATDVWLYHGKKFDPPASWFASGAVIPALPDGILKSQSVDWDRAAIKTALAEIIGKPLHREAGKVTIGRTGTGKIVFDGVGMTGRDVDLEDAATLTLAAIRNNATDVMIPVTETQPQVTVTDPTLTDMGIREVVTIGESDFSNSPNNRRHNIKVGMDKFNGHIIPKDSIFSFDEVLGPVNGKTGYLQELVIKGDKTIPDYGGGLCQVSTTAYRGIWEYGFPIVQRINHSYTVSHYFPQGTDATVYPPYVDMKFLNDSPGALLMQTYREGDLAYFIYYGTKDDRRSEVFGPYTWDHVPPPPDKTEYTSDLPPGTKKKVGEKIPGLKALWYRVRTTSTGALVTEPVLSLYQARPLFYLVGAESAPATASGVNLLPIQPTE